VSEEEVRQLMATLLALCEVSLPYRERYSIEFLITTLKQLKRYREVPNEVLREAIVKGPKKIYHHRVVLHQNETMLSFT